MSLSKYYKILGLPDGTDHVAVRKQYRKLVMRYHPDKNQSAGAHTKFIAITEAYEILTGKKPAPASRESRATRTGNTATRTNEPQASAERKAKSDAERVREARERQEEQTRREREENERYFRHLTSGYRWKIVKISAIVSLICAISLTLDRFLPHHFEPIEISGYAPHQAMGGNREILDVVVSTTNETYWISNGDYDLYARSPFVLVESSWIFHQPIRLVAKGKLDTYGYDVHFSFFSNYIYFFLFFLLPTITLYYKRPTISFTIIYQLSFWGVNLVLLYFLFRNDHWAHFLALGFI